MEVFLPSNLRSCRVARPQATASDDSFSLLYFSQDYFLYFFLILGFAFSPYGETEKVEPLTNLDAT